MKKCGVGRAALYCLFSDCRCLQPQHIPSPCTSNLTLRLDSLSVRSAGTTQPFSCVLTSPDIVRHNISLEQRCIKAKHCRDVLEGRQMYKKILRKVWGLPLIWATGRLLPKSQSLGCSFSQPGTARWWASQAAKRCRSGRQTCGVLVMTEH